MISYAHDQEQAARQRAADSAHLAHGGEKDTRCHTMLLGMVIGAAVGGLITYIQVREYVAAAQAMAAKGSDPSGAVAGGTPAGDAAAPPSPAPASPVEKPAASSILEDTDHRPWSQGTGTPYFPNGARFPQRWRPAYFASDEGDVTGEEAMIKCRAYHKLKKYVGTLAKAGFEACAVNLLCLHWSEDECDDMVTLRRLFAQDFKTSKIGVCKSQAAEDFRMHNLTALRDEKNIESWLIRFGLVLTSNVLDNTPYDPKRKGEFLPKFSSQVLNDRLKEAGLTPARLKSKPARDYVRTWGAKTAYA